MDRPNLQQLVHAALVVATTVGAERGRYCFEGRIAVALRGHWDLLISPDDAGRIRVDVCHARRPRATMWCLAGDDDRLVELASAADAETAALAV